jgi:multiple sugar transport system substrate-binding protein/raffinose/stachyose/melibiose transport system substrate-binding protein
LQERLAPFREAKLSPNEYQTAEELDSFLTTRQAGYEPSPSPDLPPTNTALIDDLVALAETIRPDPAFVASLETRLRQVKKPDKAFPKPGLEPSFDNSHSPQRQRHSSSENSEGEKLLWENSAPTAWLAEWLLQLSQAIIGHPWQRLRQRSPLAALMVQLVVVGLLGVGVWFTLQGHLESSPPPTATPRTIKSAPPNVQLVYDSTKFCPAVPVDIEAIRGFVAAHPHVELERRCLSSFFYRIEKDLASPTPPNLSSLFAGFDVRALASQGLLLDISDLWDGQGLNEAYPEWLRKLSSVDDQQHLVFINPAEPPLQLELSGTGNGQQYFLPTAYAWWAIYYSKPIFDQYNLEPPKTWDEFLAVSETLKQNGITPITIPDERAWFDYLNIRLNGPEFHRNLLRGQERYHDPRVKAVFEAWQVLKDNDYFQTRFDSYGYSQSILSMHRGEAAMALGNSFFIRDAIPEKFQDDFGSFPFPIIDPTVPVGENALTFGYVIPAHASEQKTAREFLAHLSSLEAQTYLVKTPGLVPAHAGVDPNLLTPEVKQGQALIEGADYVMPSYDWGSPRVMDRTGSRVFRWFLNKPNDLDSILATLEEARQEAFAGM